jgi:multicomponent Na+:H+ antiporter subunit F
MKIAKWAFSALLLAAFIVADIMQPFPLFLKWLFPVLLACALVIVRIGKGPTAADRAAALYILGLFFVTICGLIAVVLKRGLYMDIAIAWAIQVFIGTAVIAKFLEGRNLDD